MHYLCNSKNDEDKRTRAGAGSFSQYDNKPRMRVTSICIVLLYHPSHLILPIKCISINKDGGFMAAQFQLN